MKIPLKNESAISNFNWCTQVSNWLIQPAVCVCVFASSDAALPQNNRSIFIEMPSAQLHSVHTHTHAQEMMAINLWYRKINNQVAWIMCRCVEPIYSSSRNHQHDNEKSAVSSSSSLSQGSYYFEFLFTATMEIPFIVRLSIVSLWLCFYHLMPNHPRYFIHTACFWGLFNWF